MKRSAQIVVAGAVLALGTGCAGPSVDPDQVVASVPAVEQPVTPTTAADPGTSRLAEVLEGIHQVYVQATAAEAERMAEQAQEAELAADALVLAEDAPEAPSQPQPSTARPAPAPQATRTPAPAPPAPDVTPEAPAEPEPPLPAPAEPEAAPVVPGQDHAGAMALLSLLNAERAAVGLAGLSYSGSLEAVAAGWSSAMASSGSMTHNPRTPDQIPGGWSRWGENVAYAGGYADPAGTINGNWMNSPGHRDNMLNPSFTQVGIGYVTDASGTTWATQVFAAY